MKTKSTTVKNILSGMLLLLASALMLSCTQKSGYTITGEIDPQMFSVDSIYLYRSDATPFASAPVKDGKFTLKGHVEKVEKAMIGNIGQQFATNIIIENGQQYELLIKDDMILLKGGDIQEKVLGFVNSEEYKNAVRNYNETGEALLEDYDENDKERAEEIELILDEKGNKVLEIENAHFARLIEGNEPTIVKLLALTETQDWRNYPVEKRNQLLDEYEKELGQNELIDEYRDYLSGEEELLAAAQGVSVGNPYINITAQTREKQPVELANVIAGNKYTLLEFWASWCGPCRAEIPHLKRVYEKYKSEGFEIYAISVDDEEADWLKALDEVNTPWINVRNAEGFNGGAVKSYGIQGVPSSFLIDKEGNIVASMDQLRGEEMDKVMEGLF
ncbi:MAG: TlpA disulfide reductase family protein [Bacteroidia bacterium]|nr:TlpA disulfide reductase family protein [Bacteroidia bacterium]